MAVEGHIATGDVIAGYEVEELVGRGGHGRDLPRPRSAARAPRGAQAARRAATRRTRAFASASCASRGSRRRSTIRTWCRSTRPARPTTACSSRCASSRAPTSRRSSGARARWSRPARSRSRAQVADALDAAHARGLVHRDVKPSNVLLDRQDRREHVYLADFGLTQSVTDRGPTDGHLVGTVDYVAPEQIRGDDVDGRADVYGLGCMLFEALTGTVPFSGVSDVAVIYAHLEAPPPRASERRSTPARQRSTTFSPARWRRTRRSASRRAGARRRGSRARSGSTLVHARPACSSPPRRPPSSRSSRPRLGAVLVLRDDTAVRVARRRDGSDRREPPARCSPRRPTRLDADTGRRRERPGLVRHDGHDLAPRSRRRHARQDRGGRLRPRPRRARRQGVRRARRREAARGLRRPVRRASTARGPTASRFSPAAWRPRRRSALGGRMPERPAARGSSRTASRRAVSWCCRSSSRRPRRTLRQCLCAMTTGAGSIWVVGDAADRRVFRIAPSGRAHRRRDASGRAARASRSRAAPSGSALRSTTSSSGSTPPRTAWPTASTSAGLRPASPPGRAASGWRCTSTAAWSASTRSEAASWRRSTSTGIPDEIAAAGDELWVASDAR